MAIIACLSLSEMYGEFEFPFHLSHLFIEPDYAKNGVGKSSGLGRLRRVLVFFSFYLLVLWPWTSHLKSLGLTFLMYKIIICLQVGD